ncbi:MAG: sulfite exporter TauE/SafE family protein [Phycisphaeraceae bacterium]|nr:sulfite exporter TauE/SafE family protein [Phycisphaeraceae bacterium]
MIELFATVLGASLLGSLHCAGMCGAFVAVAVGLDAPGQASRRGSMIPYHLGRLMTYMTLGALAGLVGGAVQLGGALIGVQRGALLMASVTILGFGIIALLRTSGVRVARPRLPGPLRALVTRAHRRALDMSPTRRALTIGLLTTLLPCGWLYAFVAVAAGTAHPLWAMLTMAVFWIGTLPALTIVGVGVRAATGSLGRALPRLMPIALILVAIASIVLRGRAPVAFEPSAQASVAESVRAVEGLDHTQMPCCEGEIDDR